MMNTKKILFSVFAFAVCCIISAKDSNKANSDNVFVPHWYVQAQAGVQNSLGEIDWTKLFSPNAQVAVGYNFNKYLGARLNVNAWQSKAGSKINGKTYKWANNYIAPEVDAVVNVSNMFNDNPKRLVTVSVFGGIGANIAYNNDEAVSANKTMVANRVSELNDQYLHYLWTGTKTRFMGQFGAMVDFRLNDLISLGLELSANTLNDHYNSKRAGNSDWYFNALAGVKVNLGKTYKAKELTTPITTANSYESAATDAEAAARAAAKKAKAEDASHVEAAKPKMVETNAMPKMVETEAKPVETAAKAVVAKKEVEPLRRDIFFLINSSKVSVEEGRKVKEIAEYLKANPNAKVTITGYADRPTGNKSINQRLSQRRANIVASMLIENYGIPASRIVKEAMGDKVQPFQVSQRNRVSICIAK